MTTQGYHTEPMIARLERTIAETERVLWPCTEDGMTFLEACLVAAYEDDGSYPVECARCGAWHIARPVVEELKAA